MTEFGPSDLKGLIWPQRERVGQIHLQHDNLLLALLTAFPASALHWMLSMNVGMNHC